MVPYARKIACANHSSERGWALITTRASRGPTVREILG
jgi:hypothetical protein